MRLEFDKYQECHARLLVLEIEVGIGDIDSHSKRDGGGANESLGGVASGGTIGGRVGGNRVLTDGSLHGGTEHTDGGRSHGVHIREI